MKAPGTAYDDPLVGKDLQPAHMDDYVETIRDNGGVHINSGIPNRAFYLAATEIGGYAWEVTDGSGTRRCATPRCAPTPASPPSLASPSSRRSLQGQGSAVATAVKDAWDMVGVLTEQPALQSLTAH